MPPEMDWDVDSALANSSTVVPKEQIATGYLQYSSPQGSLGDKFPVARLSGNCFLKSDHITGRSRREVNKIVTHASSELSTALNPRYSEVTW